MYLLLFESSPFLLPIPAALPRTPRRNRATGHRQRCPSAMSISDVHQRHQPTNDNDNDNDTVTASDLADALRMYGPYICDGAEMSHVPYTHTLSLSLSLSLRICSLQYAVYFANVLNLGTFLSGAKGILFFFFTCAVLVVVVMVVLSFFTS